MAASFYNAYDDMTQLRVDRPLASVEAMRLDGQSFDTVTVEGSALAGRGADLSWLARVTTRRLVLMGRRVPAVPVEHLRTLESLVVVSQSCDPIPARELLRLTHADIDVENLGGTLAEIPMLDFIRLGRFRDRTLEVLSGCHELQGVTIEYVRGSGVTDLDLRCSAPPPRLRSLEVRGAGVRSLEGVQDYPALENLDIEPRSTPLDQDVDLSPLSGCARLETVSICMNGRLHGAEALLSMPRLRQFDTYPRPGYLTPTLPPAPWLQ